VCSEQVLLVLWPFVVLWLLHDAWLAGLDLAHAEKIAKEQLATNTLLRANNTTFTMQLLNNDAQHHLLCEIRDRLATQHHHYHQPSTSSDILFESFHHKNTTISNHEEEERLLLQDLSSKLGVVRHHPKTHHRKSVDFSRSSSSSSSY
jgi:hypothetical protein